MPIWSLRAIYKHVGVVPLANKPRVFYAVEVLLKFQIAGQLTPKSGYLINGKKLFVTRLENHSLFPIYIFLVIVIEI